MYVEAGLGASTYNLRSPLLLYQEIVAKVLQNIVDTVVRHENGESESTVIMVEDEFTVVADKSEAQEPQPKHQCNYAS